MTTDPIKTTAAALSRLHDALPENPANDTPVEAAAREVVEADLLSALVLSLEQALAASQRQDIIEPFLAHITACVELVATDPREPERYRTYYAEALDALRRYDQFSLPVAAAPDTEGAAQPEGTP